MIIPALLAVFLSVWSTPYVKKQLDDVILFLNEENDFLLQVNLFGSDDKTPVYLDFDPLSLPPGLKSSLSDFELKSLAQHKEIVRKVVPNKEQTIAYAAAGSLHFMIFDISNINNFKIPVITDFDIGFAISSTMAVGEREDISFLYTDGTFYNVTDPYTPSLMSTTAVKYYPFIDGNYFYGRENNRIDIFDIHEFSGGPMTALSTSITYVGSEGDFEVFDDILYAVSDGREFSIYNVSEKTSPKVLYKEISLPDKASALSKKANSDLLFIANWASGVLVYNVSNKTSPEFVTAIKSNFVKVRRLEVIGNHLYVFDIDIGLKIFDIKNITGPIELYEFYLYNGNGIVVGENFVGLSREVGGGGILFLTFGNRKLTGIPTVVGDYPIKVNFEDATGERTTNFTLYVRKRIECMDATCSVYMCNGTMSNSTDVCSGHGECVKFEYYEDGYECRCNEGYSSSGSSSGRNCEVFSCGGFSRWDYDNVCNGRGKCIENNLCECKDDYFGNLCQNWKCHGIESTLSDTVCSGSGRCKSPDTCKCDRLFTGETCSVNLGYSVIMAPLLSVSGVVMFILIGITIFAVVVCICVIVCSLCCCVLLLCSGSFVLCGRVLLQQLRLRKFGRIRDIDLIIKEQEMDDDSTIAHLRINKDLFKIDYGEIKVHSILGEGGSNSVVYLARWKGIKTAFKAFKTRMICADQDSFNEFEREVEVLGSVSHPNIISFYGACLDPPRVGILMEYCENGDLEYFFRKYIVKNDKPYPVREKLRMVLEISSSVDYMHSRNIIHRDLKLENVLVDGNEKCKLMDFGLSRIVEKMDIIKTQRLGTSYFMAPEVVTSSSYTEKIDVYSFAIMLFIIFSGNNFPYGADAEAGIELKVAKDENFRPDVTEVEFKKFPNLTKVLRKLIVECWQDNPTKRPSMEIISQRLNDEDSEIDFFFEVEEESLSSSSDKEENEKEEIEVDDDKEEENGESSKSDDDDEEEENGESSKSDDEGDEED